LHLLIIDDHPLFVEGFTAMLKQRRSDWRVSTAASAGEGLQALDRGLPDLAIVDVLLPDDDGFELVRAAEARWPALPMILVSGRDQPVMRTRARASGARGFIPKTTPAGEFIARMEAVLAGGTAFDSPVEAGDVPVLTTRQSEILDLLAQGHGNKEVRYRLGIAERTVRAHLTELFQLLGVHGRMPAVIRARELGLIE
jgi:DNA-binding NarL/FixJ family response regulator